MASFPTFWPQSLLAMPVGRRPGFNAAHPVARGMSSGFGFSCISTGNNFINLLSGLRCTNVSTGFPTPALQGTLGMCGLVDATTKPVQLSNQTTVNPSAVTLGAIVSFSGTGDGSFCAVIGIDSGQANQFGMKGVAKTLYFFGTPEVDSTFTIALNTPYFIAASVHNVVGVNFIATNLLTGQMLSQFVATGSALAAFSASPRIGVDIGGTHQANAYIAAAMMNPNAYFGLTTMQLWGTDPWSFWYPPQQSFVVGGIAGVIAAWARNRNVAVQGIAT